MSVKKVHDKYRDFLGLITSKYILSPMPSIYQLTVSTNLTRMKGVRSSLAAVSRINLKPWGGVRWCRASSVMLGLEWQSVARAPSTPRGKGPITTIHCSLLLT